MNKFKFKFSIRYRVTSSFLLSNVLSQNESKVNAFAYILHTTHEG